jgi:hypothetical protein
MNTMTFFSRFFLRNVNSSRKRFSDGRHVALLELVDGRRRLALVDADKHGPPQRHLAELVDLLGLRRREQQRLSLERQNAQNGAHVLLEADLEDAVGLVDHEHLEVLHDEAGRVAQVVEQAAGRGDEQIDALASFSASALRCAPPMSRPCVWLWPASSSAATW